MTSEWLGPRRRLVPDERVNELHCLRARVPRPEEERHADARGATTSRIPRLARRRRSRRRPPPEGHRRNRLLDAVRIHEAERASDDQAERQQPQEEPIGDPAGENARRNPPVAFRARRGPRATRAVRRALRGRGRCREPDARTIVDAGVRGLVAILTASGRRSSASLIVSSFQRLGLLITTQGLEVERALLTRRIRRAGRDRRLAPTSAGSALPALCSYVDRRSRSPPTRRT